MFETNLIEFARDHDPETLARFAQGMRARVDQDGAYRALDRAHRHRELSLCRRADGSARWPGS